MLSFDVPVPEEEFDPGVLVLETNCELFGNGDGAVPAAGAADADGEVSLAFCGVAGDEEGEEFAGLLEEFLAIFRAEDRLAHRVIVACEWP